MQGPWWHQWQLNGICRSLVGINDNSINNLSLCHWWQHSCNYSCSVKIIKIILPLSSNFSLLLASMAKGTHMSVFMWVHCLLLHLPTYCLLPLSSCCACFPCHDALSALSPCLSLMAKGIPPNVFHILFMIFMWTSIMFSIHFLKYFTNFLTIIIDYLLHLQYHSLSFHRWILHF